ncbi:MAG TPA: tripartite tricarboxylate transporter substrate binding protein [Xanthobacteraceae bacterium]|nr:tripartite tricarboxylate transporter substrate binding protein [Xanthobacteraceae bacterium]
MRRLITLAWSALASAAIAASLQFAGAAAAQETYPTRTVRFILPYGAASATDIAARMFADRLSQLWGKPVVVENRPGGDGLVSMNAFISANDDHTLWFGPAAAFTTLPYMHDTLSSDPGPKMTPVASVVNVALAVSTPAAMKIDSIDALVKLARSEPGKLNGSAANGVSDFLLFGFFKKLGLEVTEVPYRDIMQAPNDLVAGRIQVLSTSIAVVQPLANAGKIKILAVSSRQRAPSQPDVPTAIEAGYPDLTFESIGGVFAPPSMTLKVRNQIAADFQKVAQDNPEIGKRLNLTGQFVSIRGPAAFGAAIKEQRDKLAELAKILGITAARPEGR